jgi:hypothetical protein
MRRPLAPSLVAIVALFGCRGLESRRPTHFRFASVAEENVGASLDQTVANLAVVLRDRGINYQRPELNGEVARVFASKDGMDYVFDIRRSGEHGCHVRLEIDRSGQEQHAAGLLRQLQLMSG